ncbi:hypothetical protein ACOYR4_15375 [Acidovorax sp. M14]|uniref:hypothetical protein n=1 Tax=Acidovorax sp. M14 TaxID=3411354 RepID=UPI003BF5CBBF
MNKSITHADFNSGEAIETQKLIDYYEDDQERYVTALLDAKRENWRERGFNVTSRNIIKSIVDQSGLLFNKPPKLTVIPYGQSRGIEDATFNQIMGRAGWLEFFQNVDVYTRLLKTIVVLQQKYIPQERSTVDGVYRFDYRKGDALLLTMLHQGQCVTRTDITGRNITELAYYLTPYSQVESWTYRYINADVIEEWEVKGDEEIRLSSLPNPEGLVPASPFYDVRIPRNSFWFRTPEDIVSFQDNLNLFNCDLDYARAHQMQKSLFVDSPIVDSDDGTAYRANDENWSTPTPKTKKTIGGLGSIVTLEKGMTGSTPLVKFDGPDTELRALYEIMASQVRDIASDWNVNFKEDQSANSGYQVITNEMGNLALREKRAQSFESGFRRFYDITQQMYPELQEGTLHVEFGAPSLPVNRLEQEQVYQYRLQNKTATPVDIYIADGLTEEEAIAKLKRDIAIRKMMAEAEAETDQTPELQSPGIETPPDQIGGNQPDPRNTR